MFFGRPYRPPTSKARFGQRVARLFSILITTLLVGLLIGALGFVVYGIHGFLYRSDYFAMRTVTISEGLSQEHVKASMGSEHQLGDFENLRLALRHRLNKAGIMESNLLALDTAYVEGIIEGHSEVDTAVASKDYPGFLNIRVRRRVPVAIIPHDPLLSLDPTLWVIDDQGYVVRQITTRQPLASQLPYITGIDTRAGLKDGQIRSESLTLALRLLSLVRRGAPSLWRQTSEVRVEGGQEITLMLMGSTQIRFLADRPDSLIKQLAALDQLIAIEPEMPDKAAYIDLRIENQPTWKLK